MTDKTDAKPFDPVEFFKDNSTIETASAKLGELSHDELTALNDAEGKGEKRTGMLSAIGDEFKARNAEADSAIAMAQEAAERAGREFISPEDHAAEVDALTKERDAALAKNKTAKPPKAKKVKAPRQFTPDGEADFKTATTIAFGDAHGHNNPAIADLEFSADDFAVRAGGDHVVMAKLLTQAITFDGREPLTEIAAVYLLDGKGKVAGVSELRQPIMIGGGRQASFGARSLVFRPVATPASAD